MATGIEYAPRQHETEQITAHVLWMTTGLSCEGDSVAMTSATNPSLEDIIQGVIPGMPRVVIHNQVIAFEVGRGVHPGLVRRRGGQARPVRARHRGLDRQRGDQRRGPLDRLRRQPVQRPADHDQRVDRPARAEGGGGRRGRHLRDLRRDPGDEEQPDRRDGRARLPGLEVALEGRPAGHLHPRLPGAAGQHDRGADVPRVPPRRDGAGAGARRAAAAEVAVRAHRARGLQPRRLHRAGQLRHRVRLRSPLPGQARLQGAGGEVQRARARLGQRHRRLPERRRHLHGLHDAGLPRQVHAVHGCRTRGAPAAASFQRFTYGPVFRYFRKRNLEKKFDIEPEWRRRGPALTTGYQSAGSAQSVPARTRSVSRRARWPQ